MPIDGGPVTLVKLFEVSEPSGNSPFDIDKLIAQFRQQRSIDWSIPEAFLCLLLLTAVADGNFAPEEHAEIQALSRRSRALKTIDAGQMASINATINQRLKTRPHGLQEACESLPTDMRLPLFAHCVDIALADGQLLPVEVDFLNRILGFLAIDAADGKRVMEVMLIKNRF